jgi:hypothetical protein
VKPLVDKTEWLMHAELLRTRARHGIGIPPAGASDIVECGVFVTL